MIEATDGGHDTSKRHASRKKGMALTVEVNVLASTKPESGVEASESLQDTPRPVRPARRVLGNRFPVRPSLNGIDTSIDKTANPPGCPKPPPIPLKSHFRIASGQNGNRLRRPSIAPLYNGDANSDRSNNENVVHAHAARSKRMGMLRREKLNLEPVEEIRNNRVSHLRGVSHGSVLRSRSSNAMSPVNGPTSPASPRDGKGSRNLYLKRLSSLPEPREERSWSSPIVDGVKGILYALYQIHPHIAGLIGVIKCRDLKLTSLELTYYNASSHIDRLNDALELISTLDHADEDALQRVENTVQRDCASCIMAYLHVIMQLQESVKKIVAGADARYVRTLLLLLYGSMVEIKNSVRRFNVDIKLPEPAVSHGAEGYPEPVDKPLPSRRRLHRPFSQTGDKPGATFRAGSHGSVSTSSQSRTIRSLAYQPYNQRYPQTRQPPPHQQHLYPHGASTMAHSHRTNGVSLQNTISGPSPPHYSLSSRSRSNVRSTNHITGTNSSLASSMTNTPRSGQSFSLPGLQTPMQVNPLTGFSDPHEEALFESIYSALSRAYDAALQALPIARRQFAKYGEMAEEDRQPKEIRGMWRNLVWRCKACLEVSQSLRYQLISMEARDTLNRGRDDRSFWQLTKSFTQSFIELVAEMKEAKSLQLLSRDIVLILRPVQQASREAVRLIDSSPWAYLTEAGSQPLGLPSLTNSVYLNGSDARAFQHVQPGYTNGAHHYPPAPSHHYYNDVSALAAAQGASPGSAAFPATPLSAALGPAAQATIPLGPSSAYGDTYYKNEPLNSSQQTNGSMSNGRR